MGEKLATRPEPTAIGTLARSPLIHLLLYFLEKELSGTVELAAPDGRTATLLFQHGRPSKARTGEPVAYLGRGLLDLGLLTEQQLATSLAELTTAKSSGPAFHGQILLKGGLIDASQLEAGLRYQLLRKLRYVASFSVETTYAYYQAFDGLCGWGPDPATAGEPFDPLGMIWPLLQERPPRSHVDAALGRIAGSSLRLVRGADLGRLGIGKECSAAVELLAAQPTPVGELPAMSGLDDAKTQLLVYLLLVTKRVEVLRSSASRPSASAVSPAPPAAASSVPPAAVRPSVASPVPMRRTSRPAIPDAARRPLPSFASIPADMAPELAARWKEIVDRAATIDRADYFSMLDLARDATRDEVETQFLALAKQWHPDRLPAEFALVRDACSRVFSRMSEARATLTDDDLRARYMRLLADGSGSPETQEIVAKVVEAATNFQKAEVCFRRNDTVQAEALCRKAVEADATQPDYLALLAWLIALKPENQSGEKTRDALQLLDRAIGMSAKCDKAYFYRAQIYKRIGKADAALRDFRRVMELNPRNIDAAREVRLHRMRGGRPSSSDRPSKQPRSGSDPSRPTDETKTGLFGRLFKKT